MPVRPGRSLPSVIVGALLTTGLALGAGTASAAVTCSVNGHEGIESGMYCVNPADPSEIYGLLESVTEPSGGTSPATPSSSDSTVSTGNSGGSTSGSGLDAGGVPGVVGGVTDSGGTGDGTTGTIGSGAASGTETGTNGGTAAGTSPQPVVVPQPVIIPQPAALPIPDVRGSLTTPVLGTASLGGLASGVPGVLGFRGAPNASLLMAPLGSPLRTWGGENAGSPVTTASQVQAMAFDNLPGGVGTPSVAGVLILATFAAFALRHRVLRRARLAAAMDAGDDEAATEADTDEFTRA